jgi:hypothetical protein
MKWLVPQIDWNMSTLTNVRQISLMSRFVHVTRVPNDQIDNKLRELETGWEGQDIRNYELEALRQENLINLDAGYQSGSGSVGYSNAAYRGDGFSEAMGSMGGGIEIERTRQINITTAASQLPEQEYIMEREFRQ